MSSHWKDTLSTQSFYLTTLLSLFLFQREPNTCAPMSWPRFNEHVDYFHLGPFSMVKLSRYWPHPPRYYYRLSHSERSEYSTELLTTIPHSCSPAMALATQTMFGWENMLLDFIATDFTTTTQQTYYEYIGSKRTGLRWTTNLIKQLWHILQAIWLSRNWIKHETEIEGTTANTILLRGAITREYTQGYNTLPWTLYSSYFTITLDTLLTTATIYQKQWYTLIKFTREQSHSDILDEFSASSSLRAWVGLPLHNTGQLWIPFSFTFGSRILKYVLVSLIECRYNQYSCKVSLVVPSFVVNSGFCSDLSAT